MGQEELVLKIPCGDDVGSRAPLPPTVGSITRELTHSRESSGASVKFVNSNSNHRRTLSKDSHVIILPSSNVTTANSGEDVTLSDRLSNEEEDDLEVDLELDLERSEEDLHERLKDKDERMHRPGDLKSQNSDYGSFCTTPCDNFGLTRPSAAASGKMSSKSPGVPTDAGGGGAGSSGGSTGAPTGAATGSDTEQAEKGDDSSVMANDSYQRQPLLPPNSPDSCSSDDEAGANSSGYIRRKSRHPPKPSSDPVRIDVDDEEEETVEPFSPPDIPQEPLKTLLAFVFLFFAWVATTTSLALTHERVPEIDPLPDVFLDNVHYQPWGLDASEIIIMVATIGAFVLATFHQHRFVVLRRIFLLGGIHYFYRAVTMYITVLPKADPHYKCAPKLDELTFIDIARRVVKLLSGMGLSINGQHIYCGDYVYSGHTMTLLMTYLVVTEYSPKRWFLLHWFSFCVTVTGVLTLLFARGHYSIDVLIAYYITTRLWWIYHTLANNATLTARENKHNYLSNFWWWVIFRYMECNVGRPLPKGYNWPIPEFVYRRVPFLRNCRSSSSSSTTNPDDNPA